MSYVKLFKQSYINIYNNRKYQYDFFYQERPQKFVEAKNISEYLSKTLMCINNRLL